VFDRARKETAIGNRVGICVPVLGELHYGVQWSVTRDRNLQRLINGVSALTIWPFTEDAAKEFGRLAAEMRRRGRPMQQIDLQIAAIALTLGNCTVVTTDSDFSAVPALSVENWAA
jgi:tRNA(fMet)-specific endonuclease VapC